MNVIAGMFGCRTDCCCKDSEEEVVNSNIPVPLRMSEPRAASGLRPEDLPGPRAPRARKWTAGPGKLATARIYGRSPSVNEKDAKDMGRMAVHGGTGRLVDVKAPSPKTLEEMKLIAAAVKRNKNLQAVHTLEDKFCSAMVAMAWKEEVAKDSVIIEEGDLNGDYFYIVQEGSVDVFVKDCQVLKINKGGSFGELALLYLAARAAKVVASTNTVLWVIDRTHFKTIFAKQAEDHLLQFTRHMHHMQGMEKLPKRIRMEVANALEEYHFDKGDVVYRLGDKGDSFWFFIEGELEIETSDGRKRIANGSSDHPVILGEKAMGDSDDARAPRTETVTIISPSALAVTIDRMSFDMLMRQIRKRKKEETQKDIGQATASFDDFKTFKFQQMRINAESIQLKDLVVEGTLGCGGFGLVELVSLNKGTNKTYALKTLSKGNIAQAGLQLNVLSEKNCHFLCDSPFIVKLIETYSTTQTISMLMEAVLGGDLSLTYEKQQFWGKASHTKFYIAGMVLALAHMHGKRILYRDLKPENVMIDAAGYPKLTDMGWAKLTPGMTYTLCGSVVSMPPEVIKCSGHNRAADWWKLGIMTYELMTGDTPFLADSPMEIYSKIFAGIDKADFVQSTFTGDVADLIKSLCHALPVFRLPMKLNGVSRLQKHSWYRCFDWAALENLSAIAPYQPTIVGSLDLSNFPSDIPAVVPNGSFSHDEGDNIRKSVSSQSCFDDWDADFGTSN